MSLTEAIKRYELGLMSFDDLKAIADGLHLYVVFGTVYIKG
jgi:hypothetical protein